MNREAQCGWDFVYFKLNFRYLAGWVLVRKTLLMVNLSDIPMHMYIIIILKMKKTRKTIPVIQNQKKKHSQVKIKPLDRHPQHVQDEGQTTYHVLSIINKNENKKSWKKID